MKRISESVVWNLLGVAALTLLTSLLLGAAASYGTPKAEPMVVDTVHHGVIGVKFEGLFEDPTVPEHFRAIYLVTDKQTGQEWVAISGLQLSEVK